MVPFGGSYLESYMVIPKRNYLEAYGYLGISDVHRTGTNLPWLGVSRTRLASQYSTIKF